MAKRRGARKLSVEENAIVSRSGSHAANCRWTLISPIFILVQIARSYLAAVVLEVARGQLCRVMHCVYPHDQYQVDSFEQIPSGLQLGGKKERRTADTVKMRTKGTHARNAT